MQFLINEDELNVIEDASNQLNLMAGLLIAPGMTPELIEVDGLHCFLQAQQKALSTTKAVVYAREKAVREGEFMSASDLRNMIRILRGDMNHTPRDAVDRITVALSHATAVDADFAHALVEWSDAVSAVEAQAAAPVRKTIQKIVKENTGKDHKRDRLAGVK